MVQDELTLLPPPQPRGCCVTTLVITPPLSHHGRRRFLPAQHHNPSHIALVTGSDFDGFDFLITADPSKRKPGFDVTQVIHGFGGIDFRKLRIRTVPKMYIMVSTKSPFYDSTEVAEGAGHRPGAFRI